MGFCPSRKELLAVAQIAVAILAFINYYKIDIYDTPMYDIRLFEHQCVSIAIGFISLYYALGTWLWYSNVASTRMLSRFHCIIVYVTLVSLLYVTRSRYLVDYGPRIRGVYEHDVFDDEIDRMGSSQMLMQAILLLSGIIIVVQANYIAKRANVMWLKRNRSRRE